MKDGLRPRFLILFFATTLVWYDDGAAEGDSPIFAAKTLSWWDTANTPRKLGQSPVNGYAAYTPTATADAGYGDSVQEPPSGRVASSSARQGRVLGDRWLVFPATSTCAS